MESNKYIQKLIGDWNIKTILGVLIGAIAFGLLMNYGSFLVYSKTYFTTSMIVPVIVGAYFGPLPAAVATGLGNILADVIRQSEIYYNWAIGNAVLGLFVGALPLYGTNIRKGIFEVKHIVLFALLCVVGCGFSFVGIVPVFTVIFFDGQLQITLTETVIGSIMDIIVLLTLGIPTLKLLAKWNKHK